MGLADLVTPVAAAHRHDRQLGQDDGAANGRGDLLAALDTQTNVAVAVTDGNKRFEAGALTGRGLLLHGHDLQNLVLEGGADLGMGKGKKKKN